MKDRYLTAAVEEFCFSDHKLALVSGPRQCGKTTFGKMLLQARGTGLYRNWDDVEFRRTWAKHPGAIIPPAAGNTIPLVVLDEIHKDRRWKRTIKGLYDTLERPCDLLITGSARLNVYRRGSDSLLGRYFHFRLHPFSLREMRVPGPVAPHGILESIFSRSPDRHREDEENFELLMRFGPFPEPLFAQNTRKARLWRTTRSEIILREDLRDLSRIIEVGRIQILTSLLPERVGAPFSVASMREDLDVSFDTVKRWLAYLKELYYLYEIKPFSKKINRSLRKEGKVYLWDFSEVADEAARFENLVASHLLKSCHAWTDTGEGAFELHYLRDKDKHEIDFLITKDGTPWLPIEVKLHDQQPSPHWKKFLPHLPCDRGIQIVSDPAWQIHNLGAKQILVVGAAEVLSSFN